jgi:hypothetical protein
MTKMTLALLGGFASIMLAAPGLAQDPAPAAKKTLDPNEVVCEKSEVIGSRLAVKRVCMTRHEWAERRRLDRQEIDRAQIDKVTRSN